VRPKRSEGFARKTLAALSDLGRAKLGIISPPPTSQSRKLFLLGLGEACSCPAAFDRSTPNPRLGSIPARLRLIAGPGFAAFFRGVPQRPHVKATLELVPVAMTEDALCLQDRARCPFWKVSAGGRLIGLALGGGALGL